MRVINLDLENLDDFIKLCIPEEKRDHPVFQEGCQIKKRYLKKLLEERFPVGKIAYLNEEVAGMIQFIPEEEVVEINCIFVPKYQRQGLGKMLLTNLIAEVSSPQTYLSKRKGLIINAFETNVGYPQHLFFQRYGFKKVFPEKPYLLYYPIEEGWVYQPGEEGYRPLEEDRSKAIIFYTSKCPWSIYFAEMTEMMLKEIKDDLLIKKINREEEKEEVRKRGIPPYLIVNAQPINAFILDKNDFKKEVKEALRK